MLLRSRTSSRLFGLMPGVSVSPQLSCSRRREKRSLRGLLSAPRFSIALQKPVIITSRSNITASSVRGRCNFTITRHLMMTFRCIRILNLNAKSARCFPPFTTEREWAPQAGTGAAKFVLLSYDCNNAATTACCPGPATPQAGPPSEAPILPRITQLTALTALNKPGGRPGPCAAGAAPTPGLAAAVISESAYCRSTFSVFFVRPGMFNDVTVT